MELNSSSQQLSRTASRIFHQFHFIVYIVIVVIILSIIVFSLYQVSMSALDMSTRVPATAPSFDTATINSLDKLHPATTEGAPLALPSGRTNPFAE